MLAGGASSAANREPQADDREFKSMSEISPEGPDSGPQIERLLDTAFGTDRHARPSYRLREGVAPLETLCFEARDDGALCGTIRYWPIVIGAGTPAILLGPIAVHPAREGEGSGDRLIGHSLEAARRQGHRIAVALGTRSYLSRFGFTSARAHGLVFSAPADDARFLVLELVSSALAGVSGAVTRLRDISDQTAHAVC